MLFGFKKLVPAGSPLRPVQAGVFEVEESYSNEYDFFRSYEENLPADRLSISVGDEVPSVKLRHLTVDGPKEITTGELFRGKKVVLFGVPRWFTPADSSHHLTCYADRADDIKAKGVDTVACVAVDDGVAMGQLRKENPADDKVLMLADGNGDFARAIGLRVDGTREGMDIPAQHYAMVVEDGIVKALDFEKPNEHAVSNIEAMLAAL